MWCIPCRGPGTVVVPLSCDTFPAGGLENSHLILTFPAVGLKLLENSQNFDELMTTIIYFKSLIR